MSVGWVSAYSARIDRNGKFACTNDLMISADDHETGSLFIVFAADAEYRAEHKQSCVFMSHLDTCGAGNDMFRRLLANRKFTRGVLVSSIRTAIR